MHRACSLPLHCRIASFLETREHGKLPVIHGSTVICSGAHRLVKAARIILKKMGIVPDEVVDECEKRPVKTLMKTGKMN
ncbi:uncharacterized protein V6R79_011486 [Siganus canaliculatus]